MADKIEHKVNLSMYHLCDSKEAVEKLVESKGLKKLHVQLIPTGRNGKNKLLGRTLRVSHYDEMGFWLASDKTMCLPYGSAVVCQALAPNFKQVDVYVSMAENITVLLAELPPMEKGQWVQISEVEYNNGLPYVAIHTEKEEQGENGVPKVRYYPAHAFLFSFYPREFNKKHYESAGYVELKGNYLSHTFVAPYDETRLVISVSANLMNNKKVEGLAIYDTNSRCLITEVGHFATVEEAQAYKLEG